MLMSHLFEHPTNKYLLLDPSFRQWFGNSVTLNDDQRTPMVFYHGTSTQPEGRAIRKFQRSGDGLLGPGIYFTPAREYAGSYAAQEGGYVMPCYIRLVKPLVIEWHEDGAEVVRRIAKALEDNFWYPMSWARDQWDDYAGIGDEEFPRMLRDDGYDGVILKKGNEIVELTVLSPYQVKSALGNNGVYDNRKAEVHESL